MGMSVVKKIGTCDACRARSEIVIAVMTKEKEWDSFDHYCAACVRKAFDEYREQLAVDENRWEKCS